AATAGQAVEPCCLELLEHVGRAAAGQAHHALDLFRTEGLYPYGRMVSLQVPHQLEVPVELEVRVDPTLHEDACAAYGLELGDFGADLLERERVGVSLFTSSVEAAEAAADGTHVGVVDVPVDEVADRLGVRT